LRRFYTNDYRGRGVLKHSGRNHANESQRLRVIDYDESVETTVPGARGV
jgi:hypothetical protein